MARFENHFEQAKIYVRFRTKIYKHQREAGRYFLHEQPLVATSLFLSEIAGILKSDDVDEVCTDMCQFGMTSRTGGVGSALGHVLKPAVLSHE